MDAILDRKLLARVSAVIEKAKNAKIIADIPGLKRLAGRRGYYRVRLGDYRLDFEAGAKSCFFFAASIARISTKIFRHERA